MNFPEPTHTFSYPELSITEHSEIMSALKSAVESECRLISTISSYPGARGTTKLTEILNLYNKISSIPSNTSEK